MKQTCVIHGGYFGPPVLDEAAIRADARREVIEEIDAESRRCFLDGEGRVGRQFRTVYNWLRRKEGKSDG